MKDIFRIDWLPHRWINKTSILTPEERGIYIQIVNLIYCNEGPIENNPKWISGVCNCSTRLVKVVIERLLSGEFLHFQDKKLAQKRAESVLNITRTRIEHGAKGGRTKAENRLKTINNNDINSSKAKKTPRANNNNSNSISNNNKRLTDDDYWIAGKIIRITEVDRNKWVGRFTNLNADQIDDIIIDRDKWYQTQKIQVQKNWFIATEKYLAKLNEDE